ncbi:PadR family transcriptional regulator [Reichenbachiella sp.]
MKEYQLGEFEEIVMLTVGVLYDEAYGVALKNEIEERGQRSVSIGALQSTLRRLEKKGFLDSRLGEPDKERGGKPKRFFRITAYGKKALTHSKEIRSELWDSIPKIALDLKTR